MSSEKWKIVEYENVMPNKYEVSDKGHVRNIRSGKILNGNNRYNEKGYIRVCLQTTDKARKIGVHRLVMNAFTENPDTYKEVNHIDGNPSNNNLENLEYVTRKENAEHASVNNLYSSCESHHKSNFTNNEVHKICDWFSKGLTISEVAKLLNIENDHNKIVYLSRILHRITWVNISKYYSWSYDDIRYKTYKKTDIEKMCKLIFIYELKISDILNYFPQYSGKRLKHILTKIKQLKLYTDISKKYINQDKSSTTIERDEDKYYVIDINL